MAEDRAEISQPLTFQERAAQVQQRTLEVDDRLKLALERLGGIESLGPNVKELIDLNREQERLSVAGASLLALAGTSELTEAQRDQVTANLFDKLSEVDAEVPQYESHQ